MIQGLASDKVYCTHNNRQHIFKIFRACMPKNVGASYPLFRCLVPPRGTCTPVKNHCFKYSYSLPIIAIFYLNILRMNNRGNECLVISNTYKRKLPSSDLVGIDFTLSVDQWDALLRNKERHRNIFSRFGCYPTTWGCFTKFKTIKSWVLKFLLVNDTVQKQCFPIRSRTDDCSQKRRFQVDYGSIEKSNLRTNKVFFAEKELSQKLIHK